MRSLPLQRKTTCEKHDLVQSGKSSLTSWPYVKLIPQTNKPWPDVDIVATPCKDVDGVATPWPVMPSCIDVDGVGTPCTDDEVGRPYMEVTVSLVKHFGGGEPLVCKGAALVTARQVQRRTVTRKAGGPTEKIKPGGNT